MRENQLLGSGARRSYSLLVLIGLLGILGWGLSEVSASRPRERAEGVKPLPGTVATPRRQPLESRGAEDALTNLNQETRTVYVQGRALTLANLDPVLVNRGDAVVLFFNGDRTEKKYVPEIYHHLKAFAHVPMTLFLLLEPYRDGKVDAARLHEFRSRLADYRAKLTAAEATIGIRGFTPEQEKRQLQIVNLALHYLDHASKLDAIDPNLLGEYALKMRPLTDANLREAGAAQLDALHAQVMDWKKKIPARNWQNLRVVVMGGHTPRTDNLAMQYYTRLLGQNVDDRRLVYAEGVADEKEALNVLARCVLDSELAKWFYGDPLHLHRDLLADVAKEHLKKLTFPQ